LDIHSSVFKVSDFSESLAILRRLFAQRPSYSATRINQESTDVSALVHSAGKRSNP
jgi:hypothetical protein